MNIACIGYRDWALSIYKELIKDTDHAFLVLEASKTFDEQLIRNFEPDIVLLYGWSWIVDNAFIAEFNCLMLHPAPLPKYRGGSPIQNQIINDEVESAVTIFLMDEGVDTGPILCQEKFSLEGDLNQIFERIILLGVKLTRHIIINGICSISQDESKATYFSRRSSSDSEITLDELIGQPASYLHNKIRMLQDPYPNAYITASDGRKIFILKSRLEGQ